MGQRQLPGNARAAGLWSAKSGGLVRSPEGCGLPGRQQAEAFCRVNRAQPRAAPAVSAARRGWAALLDAMSTTEAIVEVV